MEAQPYPLHLPAAGHGTILSCYTSLICKAYGVLTVQVPAPAAASRHASSTTTFWPAAMLVVNASPICVLAGHVALLGSGHLLTGNGAASWVQSAGSNRGTAQAEKEAVSACEVQEVSCVGCSLSAVCLRPAVLTKHTYTHQHKQTKQLQQQKQALTCGQIRLYCQGRILSWNARAQLKGAWHCGRVKDEERSTLGQGLCRAKGGAQFRQHPCGLQVPSDDLCTRKRCWHRGDFRAEACTRRRCRQDSGANSRHTLSMLNCKCAPPVCCPARHCCISLSCLACSLLPLV